MRPIFIAVGVVAILMAAALQLRTDSAVITAPSPSRPLLATPAPGEIFYIRPDGFRGNFVAYDTILARPKFELPRGIASADGKHYYVATARSDGTVLESYDPTTGQLITSGYYSGLWNLAAVSPTGHWIALKTISSDKQMFSWAKQQEWKTTIQIINGQDNTVAHLIKLDGNFEVNAISNTGDSLFLLQYFPPVDPDHSVNRLYDLSADKLLPDPLGDQGRYDAMIGDPTNQVATADGGWLLTLFLDTRRGIAFISTINFTDKSVVPVDLPSESAHLGDLANYSIVLSPDGSKVYAVNPVLHIIAKLDLQTRSITRTLHYVAPPSGGFATFDPNSNPSPNLVASPKDAQRIYFAVGSDIWVSDVDQGKVSGPFAAGADVHGLGVTKSGELVYAVTSGAELARVFNVLAGGVLKPIN